jgi:hypothetical protein
MGDVSRAVDRSHICGFGKNHYNKRSGINIQEDAMKRQWYLPLILFALFVLVLSCQIADVIGMGPTPMPPTQPPVVVLPTSVPPTKVVVAPPPPPTPIPPTQAIVAPQPTQVVVAPTQPPPPPVQPTTALPPGCSNANATITSLTDNGTVSGLIEIRGTATDTQMQYWKVEYRPEANTSYDQLNQSDKGITDDVIARLSTKTIPNGVYFIRLVIVKKDGNFPTPCEFRVRVQN